MMMRNKLLVCGLACLLTGCLPLPSIDEGADQKDPDHTVVSVAPIAYYTFDGSAADKSGSGFNGVLAGSPEFVKDTPDGSASSLKLNGFKQQYVNIPFSILSEMTKLSVSFWIKDFSQGVIFTSNGESLGRCSPRLRVTDSQQFEFYTSNGYYDTGKNHHFVYDCTSIMSTEWHHIVVTATDGINSLYVDGTKMDSMNVAYGGNASTKFIIGGNMGGLLGTYMTMKIDNLAFYDVCLTEKEVKNLYQNRK